MSDTKKSGGLFSKVVRFVCNPVTGWSDLDNKESTREEAYSKQLLKEMLERKRRNDFVRKREFDILRKMRKREHMVGQIPGVTRPSFFQSSMPSTPDDRAVTLRKIDEIEAQMSMQWWKTNHGELTGKDAASSFSSVLQAGHSQQHVDVAPAPMLSNALPDSYAATKPGDWVEPEPAQQPTPVPPPRPASPVRVTQPVSKPVVAQAAAPKSKGPTSKPIDLREIRGLGAAGAGYDGASSEFTNSKLFAVEVEEVMHDAEHEEAAICFSNGDDEGAEAALLEALGPQGSREHHSDTWLTLFDLYRAIGQQSKFDRLAIDFVKRFNRSSPQWFSMPEMVESLVNPVGVVPEASTKVDWSCPAVLGAAQLEALQEVLQKKSLACQLDWSELKTLQADALPGLRQMFSEWSNKSAQLRFIDDRQLQLVLKQATPAGQREVDQAWWYLRMDALRVLNRPDEFELAALEFCVNYEVSPPSWQAARCDYKSLGAGDSELTSHTIISEVYKDTGAPPQRKEAATHADWQMMNLYAVELSGQLKGDALAALETLNSKLTGADVMMISCAKLIRVDFAAAGTVLNWVAAREAENRVVEFVDVNRLILSLFSVVGITAYAKVSARRD